MATRAAIGLRDGQSSPRRISPRMCTIKTFAAASARMLYAAVAATLPRARKYAMARGMLVTSPMMKLSNVDLSLVTGGANRPTIKTCRAADQLAGKLSGYAKAEAAPELMNAREWKQAASHATESADDCFRQVLRRR